MALILRYPVSVSDAKRMSIVAERAATEFDLIVTAPQLDREGR